MTCENLVCIVNRGEMQDNPVILFAVFVDYHLHASKDDRPHGAD